MNCPRCGKPVSNDNIICDSCGMIFNNNSNTTDSSNTNFNVNKNRNFGNNFNENRNNNYSNLRDQVTFQQLLSENGVTQEEVSAFIGPKNRSYYLNAFNKITTSRNYNLIDFSNSGARNFNLGKILSVFWLLYRKMYQEAVYGFIAIIGAGIIQGMFGWIILIGWIISFVASIVWLVVLFLIMIYGDQMYRDFVIKRVKEIKQMYGNSSNYYDILSRSGGTLV